MAYVLQNAHTPHIHLGKLAVNARRHTHEFFTQPTARSNRPYPGVVYPVRYPHPPRIDLAENLARTKRSTIAPWWHVTEAILSA
jgi:hypothetical protein